MTLCSWEGHFGSVSALAMHHGLGGLITYTLNSQCPADERPTYVPLPVLHIFCIFEQFLLILCIFCIRLKLVFLHFKLVCVFILRWLCAVKYLGLMAMSKILKTHPKSVQAHKDLILQCLDDKDESIRLRALDLLYGMVSGSCWINEWMNEYVNLYLSLIHISEPTRPY